MKLQSLAIIFIIIIMPITIVLNEYVTNKVTIARTELTYDTRLLNSTHDAIKTYQLNTINNAFGDIKEEKKSDIESSINTFFSSLNSSFNYTGYKSDVMKEYVPAIAFTLYDGYYIYSPYSNTLTGVATDGYDKDYSKDEEWIHGLKPYVSYSCRYQYNNNDFVITYTLDNYITIQGMIGGTYENTSGYLVTGITNSGEDYIYDGVTFSSSTKECLTEYLGTKESYPYVKINGKKYYKDNDKVFFIDNKGRKTYIDKDEKRSQYIKAIDENKSAYSYYKAAYEFTNWVTAKLSGLKSSHAVIYNDGNSLESITKLSEYGDINIFSIPTGGQIQNEYSNFNKHRRAVIRYIVETNLITAITSFKFNAKSAEDFIMPKISETDWDLIENDVCAISFLQGLSLGSKRYNGYSVVANTLTKEYVDEDDIYICTNDNTYCRVNDKTLNSGNIKNGIWKVNFEKTLYFNNDKKSFYNPMADYYGTYSSIYGNYDVNKIETDMYDYVENCKNDALKKAYYTALGRERWGAYHMSNDTDLAYFFNEY